MKNIKIAALYQTAKEENANRWGNSGNNDRLYFFWAPKSLQMVTAAMKLKDVYSLEEKLWPTWTSY